MFERSRRNRRYAGPAAVSAGLSAALLITGCSGLAGDGRSGAPARPQVRLQAAAEQGSDPFTASTATLTGAGGKLPAPHASAGGAGTARPVRTVLGSKPGLYGGVHSVASCDVEQQIRLLVADGGLGRAFAHGAGVSQEETPAFLRELTPMVLRADTRVTGHGYRDGAADRFQAILQTGTAVLVDEYGSPRVRCASGSPLASPVVDPSGAEEQGKAWPGYDRERVVVITRAAQVIDSFVIVDVVGNTWLSRKSGTDGEADMKPAAPPAYDPGMHVTEAPEPQSGGPDAASPQQSAGSGSLPPIRPDVSTGPKPNASGTAAANGNGNVNGTANGTGNPSRQGVPAAPVPDATGGGVPADPNLDPELGGILFGPDSAPGAGNAAPDAILPDAGVPDAGVPDAGAPDAGVPDASVPDAAGNPVPDAAGDAVEGAAGATPAAPAGGGGARRG
ncbi:DUF6777 domain-containing protein [Streptomyces sp. FIT100]|uniref:DUF6777 domain-containing protein n=1 Tax=Streptomyces sp. FIT100 TaxID=2837956 RepID=UPI0021C8EA2D|nr:DUF6777 domain-containing protein [Streptomyces sp. FIT100]UUN30497.1 hypothetical protein KK483_32275 [Streptomyces sp. FIT100]